MKLLDEYQDQDTLLRSSLPVAAIEHECILCGKPIKIGQKYILDVWVSNGRLLSVAYHREKECSAR
jgi:hypothetical protein